MLFNDYQSINEAMIFNANVRYNDFKNSNHDMFDSDMTLERYNFVIDIIKSLPYYNDLNEFTILISDDRFEPFRKIMFSKGLDRIKSLNYIINRNWINDLSVNDQNSSIYFDFGRLGNNRKNYIICCWICYNQIFADGNHRTAHYLLTKFIPIANYESFINYIKRDKSYYIFRMPGWHQKMLCVIQNFDIIF